MDILSIDIGTYSIKFVRGVLERRQVRFLESHEEVIADASKDFHSGMPMREKQIEIVGSFLNGDENSRVIFQVPNWLLTSRYLTLPTNKQKQVAMMIPFQLDEKLPYPVTESHYISLFDKKKDQSHVTISIVQKNDFRDYHHLLERTGTLPSVLTSELFIMSCYLKNHPLPGSLAILDLGHETTKAYFVYNGRIVSNQTSYVGGKIINEAIAETYGISIEEASDYKHKNCFFLTTDQYEELSQEQKDFAELMEKIFLPFIQEYKRWEIGHRVNCGEKVETVYIMGGTAKISNISNFLTEALDVKIDFFPENGHDKKDEKNYSLARLMGLTQRGKYSLPNFLYGEYSGKVSNDIFLNSVGFIFSRALAASVVIILFLLIERFAFIYPEISRQDKINRKIFKDPKLALTARDKRVYRKKPEKMLQRFQKKFDNVEQEVSTILSSTSINALSSLSLLSSYLDKSKGVELVEFVAGDGVSKAVFTTKKPDALKNLEQHLKTLALPYKKIIRQKNGISLTLTFGKKKK